MEALLADAEQAGAVLAVASEVVGGRVLQQRASVGLSRSMGSSSTGTSSDESSENSDSTTSDRSSGTGVSSESSGSGSQRGSGSEAGGAGVELQVLDRQSGERATLRAGLVVNSAGGLA